MIAAAVVLLLVIGYLCPTISVVLARKGRWVWALFFAAPSAAYLGMVAIRSSGRLDSILPSDSVDLLWTLALFVLPFLLTVAAVVCCVRAINRVGLRTQR
jgi:hypothetical protein